MQPAFEVAQYVYKGYMVTDKRSWDLLAKEMNIGDVRTRDGKIYKAANNLPMASWIIERSIIGGL